MTASKIGEELSVIRDPNPYKSFTVEQVFNLEPPEWLIKEIIPKGGATLLYGQTNVGKSLLALDWAFKLALGWDWIGQFVERPVRVLYAYAEGGHDLQLRYQAWLEATGLSAVSMHRRNLEENIRFIGLDEDLSLRWPPDNDEETEGVRRLYDNCDEFQPDLVVFDPAQEVWMGMDGNNETQVQMVRKLTKQLRNKYGAASLIVHHANKEGQTFRGVTTWLDLSDTGFSIVEDENVKDLVHVRCTKNRMAGKGTEWTLERKQVQLAEVPKLLGMDSVVLTNGRYKTSTRDDKKEMMLETLREHAGGLASSELCQMVYGVKKSSTYDRDRDELVNAGLIYKEPGTNRGKYKLTANEGSA